MIFLIKNKYIANENKMCTFNLMIRVLKKLKKEAKNDEK
ncbi:hypothetical protein PB7211_1163 [Candidatus Pelagibacter sp. HTCC7211]|nr:hypothetical protein PB7211_1163 [Candidatus Pelagibacter sp. HTCC7211]